ATEGNSGTTTMSFPVSISVLPAAGQTEIVKVATADGTATAGSDYTAAALTTLTWTSSSSSLTQVVNVTVSGDTTVEANETLFLNLSGDSKNAVLADKQGLGTIVNDD